LPETAGCLKSQYHGEHFTVLRCSVIMVYNSLTGNTTHHMERQVLFFICSEKTKLKQIWSTAKSTATSQKSVLLCSLTMLLFITRTSDSVIYSILCYFLHFRLERSPQHLFAIPYFPLGEKQISPHAESKIRIL